MLAAPSKRGHTRDDHHILICPEHALKSSLEIAQEATLRPIMEIATEAGIHESEVDPYGRTKAKISLDVLERLKDRPDGKIICVTAITPT